MSNLRCGTPIKHYDPIIRQHVQTGTSSCRKFQECKYCAHHWVKERTKEIKAIVEVYGQAHVKIVSDEKERAKLARQYGLANYESIHQPDGTIAMIFADKIQGTQPLTAELLETIVQPPTQKKKRGSGNLAKICQEKLIGRKPEEELEPMTADEILADFTNISIETPTFTVAGGNFQEIQAEVEEQVKLIQPKTVEEAEALLAIVIELWQQACTRHNASFIFLKRHIIVYSKKEFDQIMNEKSCLQSP